MRGSFRAWGGILLVAMLALAACGQPAPAAAPAAAEATGEATASSEASNETPASEAAAASDRCGDKSKLSASVSFYNWGDYIDPDVLTTFEEECGVKVIYDTFSSNEDLLAKLQGGASGYDLIVPSDYMVAIMVQLGLLKELDPANIPNLANINGEFLDQPFDPGNKYSVPYLWGVAGIGYDADKVTTPPASLADLFDPAKAEQYAGKISLLNDSRETIGAALKYLGYSVNSTDPAQLEEAKQVLLAIKPYVLTFDSDTFADLVVSGETVMGHGWNGNFAVAISENPDRNLGFVIPKEGLTLYIDNLAIPASAPNPYTAEVLINFLHDPEIAAKITTAVMYPTPNDAALEFVPDEIKNNVGIYPPREALGNAEYITDVGEATQLYERIWTEIKAQ
jgi:spermidine/putrescine transport system substrate-binding protein